MANKKQLPPADLAVLKKQVDAEGILLKYQRDGLRDLAAAPLGVVEKSRRIGFTWAEASDDVLYAATARRDGGDDVSYIGYNLDMAREYIDAAGNWARAFNYSCSDIEEFLFQDKTEPGREEKYIMAFRIDFGSGNKIVALSSKPRSLRGRRGRVVIDEAAFHDDLDALLKAALALLVWGGQVRVISTHDGVDNPFNQLINDIRAKKRAGTVVRVTFDDAIKDGLYERVCLVKGEEPTLEGRVKWIHDIRAAYGDAAEEELDCIPRKSGGTYLPLALIEARSVNVPVLRWKQDNDFTFFSKAQREAACLSWCRDNLAPVLNTLNSRNEHAFGSDFARAGDQSVVWPLEIAINTVRKTPFVVELDNIPYDQQRQILFFIINRLPRFRKGAMDATGNGEYLAEAARQEWGTDRIIAVRFSESWYRENMPSFKSAFEDGMIRVPRDTDIQNDIHMFRVVDGVARMPKTRRIGASGSNRHGDAGIAAVLAHWASRQDAVVIDYESGHQRGAGYTEAIEAADIGFGAAVRAEDYGGF